MPITFSLNQLPYLHVIHVNTTSAVSSCWSLGSVGHEIGKKFLQRKQWYFFDSWSPSDHQVHHDSTLLPNQSFYWYNRSFLSINAAHLHCKIGNGGLGPSSYRVLPLHQCITYALQNWKWRTQSIIFQRSWQQPRQKQWWCFGSRSLSLLHLTPEGQIHSKAINVQKTLSRHWHRKQNKSFIT